MKFLILLVIVVSIALAEHSEEDKQSWQAFKLEHGKLFLSPGKEKDRMANFLKNKKDVQEHNEAFLNGEVTYVKQINEYSDLSDEQFLERYGGIKMPANVRNMEPSDAGILRQTPPASLDLRGAFGPARWQGYCGSCWAFSTVAAIEYAYWRKNGVVADLSEQLLVDCLYGSAGGCDGGWMPSAMDYLAKTSSGIVFEQEYPYSDPAAAGPCQESAFPNKAVKLKAYKPYVRVKQTDRTIKNALNQIGALSVCVDAGSWGLYKSGIFSSPNYADPGCSHAVALVGYGTEGGIPYQLVRNSWDTWGEQGYMRLDARRDKNGMIYGGIMLEYAYYPQLK